MNEKLFDRYLKVKAHADRGVAGERESALKILADLETKYPGLGAAAAAHAKKQGKTETPLPTAASAPDPFPSGHHGSSHPGPSPRGHAASTPSRTSGNWENLFRYAQGVYETVKEVVEDASAAQYGRSLAESEVEMTAGSRDRSIFVRMKIPFETVAESRELNSLQKESFRKAVHDMLDEYIDAVLQD